MGSPTIKRRRLAKALKRARAEMHPPMTAKDAAGHVGISEATLSRIESNKTTVAPPTVAALLRLYKYSEQDVQALVEVAKAARRRGWWRRYTDVLPEWLEPYIGFEGEASEIKWFETQLVPGLLQTENYARAIIRASMPNVADAEVERRVALRMERQRHRETLPRMWIVLDESVLRRPVGGPGVMKAQIERLLDVRELPGVEIQILPFEAGEVAAVASTFALMSFPDPLDSPVAYLENLTSTLYLEEPAEIEQYSVLFDHLRAAAWSGRDTAAALANARDGY